MLSLTESLVRKFAKEDEDGQYDRTSIARLEGWTSIWGNTALSMIKAILGLSLGSISILADALHSASDIITSVVVLIGFKLAQRPPDEKHPYGHGRAETAAAFIIAILLMLAGLGFGKASFDRLINPVPVRGSLLVSFIIILSALFKEWIARFSIYLGKMINSNALIADAWHHRSDALSSILVAIAIVASTYGYFWLDALFGLLVSAFIIYTGLELANSSISVLMGEAPSSDLIERIKAEAMGIEGIEDIHKINVYDYGEGKKFVSFHIEVDSLIDIKRAHDIATEVQRSIAERLGLEPIIHIEPYMEKKPSPSKS